MRVIAGECKGKLLCTVDGNEITRPTSDRVKENIFNILQHEIADNLVLDLFSGSGALGIECLSRGSKFVVFVENNKLAINCIEKNLLNCKISKNRYKIINANVEKFLTENRAEYLKYFNLIFADPPYQSDWYFSALEQIENSNMCQSNCMLILEMDSKLSLNKNSTQNFWELKKFKQYGKTKLEFWEISSN